MTVEWLDPFERTDINPAPGGRSYQENGTWSADGVADCMMRGIDRGAFAITPGATITMMHRMPGILIPVLHWYCNKLADRVRRKRMAGMTAVGQST